MVKKFKSTFALTAILMVTVLLSGCFGGGTKTFTLTVNVVPEGAAEVKDLAKKYDKDSIAEFALEAAEGYEFVEWTGEVKPVGKDGKWTIVMDGDKTLTAVFKEIEEEPEPEPKTAEELVKVFEAVEPEAITSYAQVADIEAAEAAARKAVGELDDLVEANGLSARIETHALKVKARLDEVVTGVTGAENQQDLFAALDAFFLNVDIKYIVAYDGAFAGVKTVKDIQKIIDETPGKVSKGQLEELVAAAIFDAVDSKNEFTLENTLKANETHVKNVWYDGAHISKYMTKLAEKDEKDHNLKTVQTVINEANNELAGAAVEAAERGIDRAKLDYARDLVANLDAEDAEKKELQDRVDAHYLILAVNEARTASAMATALEALEGLTGVSENASVLADYVNEVQKQITAKTPVLTIDEIQTLIDVVNGQFSHFVVEAPKDATLATESAEFTIKALNKGGEVKSDYGEALTDVTAKVAGEDAQATADGFAEGKATITITHGLDTVGSYAVDLAFKVDDKAYALSSTLDMGADFDTLLVVTDKTEYASGDDIAITVTLKYGDKKVLTTENGTKAATIAIGSDFYNVDLKFDAGVAKHVVKARTAAESAEVEVTIDSKKGTAEAIKITPGAVAKFDVAYDTTTEFFTITATDGLNTVPTFDGEKTVTVSITDDKGKAIAPLAKVDYTGKVILDFTDGKFTGKIDFAALATEYGLETNNLIKEGNTVTFTVGEISGSVKL